MHSNEAKTNTHKSRKSEKNKTAKHEQTCLNVCEQRPTEHRAFNFRYRCVRAFGNVESSFSL